MFVRNTVLVLAATLLLGIVGAEVRDSKAAPRTEKSPAARNAAPAPVPEAEPQLAALASEREDAAMESTADSPIMQEHRCCCSGNMCINQTQPCSAGSYEVPCPCGDCQITPDP